MQVGIVCRRFLRSVEEWEESGKLPASGQGSASIEESEAMEILSKTEQETPVAESEFREVGSFGAARKVTGFEWKREGKTLLHYLLDSEVHTFAFSVSANAILSFIPLIVLLYSFADGVFHSPAMVSVIGDMVKYFFPSNQDFVAQNLALIASNKGLKLFSFVMILISCTGIFLPLEVALNRAWGVKVSRNYLMNQLVALGLALGMVMLGLVSVLLNAGARWLLTMLFFGHIDNFIFRAVTGGWLVVSTAVASVLFFFSIYWLLPNRKVPWRPVLRVAMVTGLLWVGAKYLFVALLPRLDLRALYGPFYVSVGLLLWAYVSGLLLFAGAQFSAMRLIPAEPEE